MIRWLLQLGLQLKSGRIGIKEGGMEDFWFLCFLFCCFVIGFFDYLVDYDGTNVRESIVINGGSFG